MEKSYKPEKMIYEPFIKTIKNYPVLWNRDDEGYKNLALRETTWETVAKECGFSNVAEAKAQWKKLRDCHRQVYRSTRKKLGHKWRYEKLMEFLIPYISSRNTSQTGFVPNFESDKTYQSLSGSEDSVNVSYNVSNESEHLYDESENMENESDNSEPDTKKRKNKINNTNVVNILKSEVDEISVHEEFLLNEDVVITNRHVNSLKAFFESMIEMCQPLPEYLQIRIQRSVFNAVMDAREEHLKKTYPIMQ